MEINGLALYDYFFNLFIFNGSLFGSFFLSPAIRFSFEESTDLLSLVMAKGSWKMSMKMKKRIFTLNTGHYFFD